MKKIFMTLLGILLLTGCAGGGMIIYQDDGSGKLQKDYQECHEGKGYTNIQSIFKV